MRLKPYKVIQPFATLQVDYIMRLRATSRGNRAIVKCTEYFSGWVIVKSVRIASAAVVLHFVFEEVVWNFGIPMHVVTNNEQ